MDGGVRNAEHLTGGGECGSQIVGGPRGFHVNSSSPCCLRFRFSNIIVSSGISCRVQGFKYSIGSNVAASLLEMTLTSPCVGCHFHYCVSRAVAVRN